MMGSFHGIEVVVGHQIITHLLRKAMVNIGHFENLGTRDIGAAVSLGSQLVTKNNYLIYEVSPYISQNISILIKQII